MRYLVAPLEGITYPEYRLLHGKLFPGADCYYAPFLAPGDGKLKTAYLEKRLPDVREGGILIPQILANDAEKFIRLANVMYDLGYGEVNLNVGCPSGTVFAKYKGAGMLRDLSSLERFLDEIYGAARMKISIKTRLGTDSPEEFEKILELYNNYPVTELIIHARTRQMQYAGKPDMEMVAWAMAHTEIPVCYNGNVFSTDSMDSMMEAVPGTVSVMLGRGVIANPALIRILSGGEAMGQNEWKSFHDRLLDAYLASGLEERTAVNRMKELWFYMGCLFPDSEKYMKKLMKANKAADYSEAVRTIEDSCDFNGAAGFADRAAENKVYIK